MDDTEHVVAGMGELDERVIAGHPRLERSAPPPCHEFPWQEVFRDLDGELEEGPRKYEEIGTVINIILHWIVHGGDPANSLFGGKRRSKKQKHAALRMVGRRAAALAWLVYPRLLDGLPRPAEKKDASQ